MNTTYAPTTQQQQRPSGLVRRSPWLITFGVLELILSIGLIGWSIWIYTWGSFVKVPHAGASCGIVHLILAILAIIGGRRGVVITCIVLGLIGAFIVGPVCLFIVGLNWDYYKDECIDCKHRILALCPDVCEKVNRDVLFGPLFVITLVLVALDLILTSVSCCNVCRCCGCCYMEETPPNIQVVYHPVNPYPQYPQVLPDSQGYMASTGYDQKTNVGV